MQEDSRAHILSVLTYRIDETQATLHNHLREVERLVRLVADLRAEFNNLGAPIASLPNEILATIFKAGCSDFPFKETRRSRKKLVQPFELLVSLVCRRWRNVAISTPSLWTHIRFLPHQPLDLVTTYFSRSGILLLDIQADLRLRRRGLLSVDLFLKAVVPHIGRWRTMHLQSNHRRYLYAIFSHIHFDSAPLLESLQIFFQNNDEENNGSEDDESEDEDDDDDDDDDESEDEDDTDTDTDTEDSNSDEEDEDEQGDIDPRSVRDILTGGAPSLETLRVKGIPLHHCVPPGSNLTVLHVHNVAGSCNKFRDIFDNFSVLTRLAIYGCDIDKGDPIPTRPSVLPRLSSLHLLPSNTEYAPIVLLQIISAPMLEHLELQTIMENDHLFHGPEWSAASPRYPRLYSLTVSPAWDDEWEWDIFHRVFPTIVVFAFSNASASYFIEAHTPTRTDLVPSPSTPWPNLQSLFLGSIRSHDSKLLREFLSRRIAQGCPLRKLSFENIYGGPKQCEKICKEMDVQLEASRKKLAEDDRSWYRDDD